MGPPGRHFQGTPELENRMGERHGDEMGSDSWRWSGKKVRNTGQLLIRPGNKPRGARGMTNPSLNTVLQQTADCLNSRVLH